MLLDRGVPQPADLRPRAASAAGDLQPEPALAILSTHSSFVAAAPSATLATTDATLASGGSIGDFCQHCGAA